MDIKSLLSSPHLTVRRCGLFTFYNSCGHSKCNHESCKNCYQANYHIRFKGSLRSRRLPNFIQYILRKRWD